MLNDAVYFVTFRLLTGTMTNSELSTVRDHIVKGSGKFYDLYSLVVMPDHVHVILKPKAPYSLSRIMKGMKGASANLLNKARNSTGSVWQDESFDRILRDLDELDEKLQYMFNNPIKRGLTEDTYSYAGWYLNNELLAG
jgi:putative transposase